MQTQAMRVYQITFTGRDAKGVIPMFTRVNAMTGKGAIKAFIERYMWGGDRLCMDGSSPRKQREALRDKAWGRTSRICTAGRKMRFFYDLCDEFCTILDCSC